MLAESLDAWPSPSRRRSARAFPPSPSEGEATSRRRGRILLVDNDPQVMSILGEIVGDAGHHVVPVGSAEALRVFVRGGFDLVMTNIGMA